MHPRSGAGFRSPIGFARTFVVKDSLEEVREVFPRGDH